jgi:teichoic acid transport system permease protein
VTTTSVIPRDASAAGGVATDPDDPTVGPVTIAPPEPPPGPAVARGGMPAAERVVEHGAVPGDTAPSGTGEVLFGGTIEQPIPRMPADPEALAAEAELRPVNEILPLRTYVRELWKRRHFVISLSWYRYESESALDRLGAFWNILRPLLQAIVYTFIFTILLGRNTPNYPEFVTAGVFVFTFLSGTLISGANAIVAELGIVRTLRFPRAVLPIAVAVLNLIQFIPALFVLGLLLVLFSNVSVGLAWFLVLPSTILMTIFAAGMALFSARMTVIVRDYRNFLPFIMRIFFYLSGTVVDVTKLGAFVRHPVAGAIAGNEPFFIYMQLVRNSLLTDSIAPLHVWLWGIGWALFAFVGGLIFFWRGERDYGS